MSHQRGGAGCMEIIPIEFISSAIMAEKAKQPRFCFINRKENIFYNQFKPDDICITGRPHNEEADTSPALSARSPAQFAASGMYDADRHLFISCKQWRISPKWHFSYQYHTAWISSENLSLSIHRRMICAVSVWNLNLSVNIAHESASTLCISLRTPLFRIFSGAILAI